MHAHTGICCADCTKRSEGGMPQQWGCPDSLTRDSCQGHEVLQGTYVDMSIQCTVDMSIHFNVHVTVFLCIGIQHNCRTTTSVDFHCMYSVLSTVFISKCTVCMCKYSV